ncbi:MAG: Stp1/IreP family PP2C-type Ser/Thr phosphatase [Firmicutes bacterium]|nr:Stp1/IreP family PP2C-type Ser/Thr phosphatase [Bacillota bacterium]
MIYGATTDIGRVRKVNEDSFYISEQEPFPYVVVADGMGGHQAGEVASLMAIDITENYLHNNLKSDFDCIEAGEQIRQAFISANNIIYTYAKNYYKIMGMGTTLTLAMVYNDKIITANVGDSRAYLIGDGIEQITTDHSYVQELVRNGDITPEQAKHHPKKNYITRAIGAEIAVKVDIGIRDYNNEKILLCSDGLTNMIDDDEIFRVMKNADSLQHGVQELVDMANAAGGYDNITIAVLERERMV